MAQSRSVHHESEKHHATQRFFYGGHPITDDRLSTQA
jgi:hypothetical protein